MNIKILSSLTETGERSNVTTGTHNGTFHSDEVLACAILCLIYSNKSVQILRTRDPKMLIQCDICVDVGSGEFDHHQAGFNKIRENGIKYASAGLVWKNYGKQLINLILEKYFPEIKCDTDYIFKEFDDSFIALVDCEDNGIQTETHCFSFISSFLPLWFNNSADDFNNQFYKALVTTMTVLERKLKKMISKEIAKNVIKFNWSNIYYFNKQFYHSIVTTITVLKQELKTTIAKKIAKNIVKSNWNNSYCFSNGILEIPSQTIDWVGTVININDSTKNRKINFVIFPYPDGGWAAQCVPPSFTEKFVQRIPFPIKWAGQTDQLSEIAGVEGATFCHNGRFFVRATSKEAIIQMCNIATN